jgi:hypothetical protein
MTPEEIKTLGHAFFDGKTLQYQNGDGSWMIWEYPYCPKLISGIWRIKPDEPKKVKYCCYEKVNGELQWFREGTLKGFKRIPELDREITLPEGGVR